MTFQYFDRNYRLALFPEGRMNFKTFFLKIFRFSDLHIFWSSWFHSRTREGKKEFWKKLCSTLNWGILLAFLVLYGLAEARVILKRYSGDFLNILKKQCSFLYHLLFEGFPKLALDKFYLFSFGEMKLYYAWSYIISPYSRWGLIKDLQIVSKGILGKVLWNLRNRPIVLLTLLYMFLRCSWKSSLTYKSIPKCFQVVDWVTAILLKCSGG